MLRLRSQLRANSVSDSGSLLCSVVQGSSTRWEQVENMDYPGIAHKLLPFPHRMEAEQSHIRRLVYPAVYSRGAGPYSGQSEKHLDHSTPMLCKWPGGCAHAHQALHTLMKSSAELRHFPSQTEAVELMVGRWRVPERGEDTRASPPVPRAQRLPPPSKDTSSPGRDRCSVMK